MNSRCILLKSSDLLHPLAHARQVDRFLHITQAIRPFAVFPSRYRVSATRVLRSPLFEKAQLLGRALVAWLLPGLLTRLFAGLSARLVIRLLTLLLPRLLSGLLAGLLTCLFARLLALLFPGC